MKTFYTVRDIEDMYAAGVAEIHTHDDIVLTDVAREKATSLGMRLIPAEEAAAPRSGTAFPRATGVAPSATPPVSSPMPSSISRAGAADAELIHKVKSAVIARLGTNNYEDLLDRIIPQVMAQLKK